MPSKSQLSTQLSTQRSTPGIANLASTVEHLLDKVGKELADAAKARRDGERRLFFPDGVELISIAVKVTGVADVELNVAGPTVRARMKPLEAFTPQNTQVTVGIDGVGYSGYQVTWLPSITSKQTLTFTNGTPFTDGVTTFDVLPGGTVKTVKNGAQGSGSMDYPYKYTPSPYSSSSKIVIW